MGKNVWCSPSRTLIERVWREETTVSTSSSTDQVMLSLST